MTAREYFAELQRTILAAPHVIRFELTFDEVDVNECYVRGLLVLSDGVELHLAEYVVTSPSIHRLKYRYHAQTPEATLIARWDNAPHHAEISTFPHHRHNANGVVQASEVMDIESVLVAVLTHSLGS